MFVFVAMLGYQLGETPVDVLHQGAIGVVSGLEHADEPFPSQGELLETAFDGLDLGFPRGRRLVVLMLEVLGEVVVPLWAEHPYGKEAEDPVEKTFLWDPDALRMVGDLAVRATAPVAVRLAAEVGALSSSGALHAPVAQRTEHVGAQQIGALGLRMDVWPTA